MVTFAELFKGCLAPGESPEDAAPRFCISRRTARLYFAGLSVPAEPKVPVMAPKMGLTADALAPVARADRLRLKKSRQRLSRKAVRSAHKGKQVVGPNHDVSHARVVARGRK